MPRAKLHSPVRGGGCFFRDRTAGRALPAPNRARRTALLQTHHRSKLIWSIYSRHGPSRMVSWRKNVAMTTRASSKHISGCSSTKSFCPVSVAYVALVAEIDCPHCLAACCTLRQNRPGARSQAYAVQKRVRFVELVRGLLMMCALFLRSGSFG